MEETLDFSDALKALKNGKKVARKGWNGKGMWIKLVAQDHYELLDATISEFKRGPDWNLESFIVMYTAQDKLQPGWLASQADMLAEDWEVLS